MGYSSKRFFPGGGGTRPPIYRQYAGLVPVLKFLQNFNIFNHVLAKIVAI